MQSRAILNKAKPVENSVDVGQESEYNEIKCLSMCGQDWFSGGERETIWR